MSSKDATTFIEQHSGIINIIGGSIATAVTIIIFVYSTFQTQDATAREIEIVKDRQDLLIQHLDKRLDRIEDKLDAIKER